MSAILLTDVPFIPLFQNARTLRSRSRTENPLILLYISKNSLCDTGMITFQIQCFMCNRQILKLAQKATSDVKEQLHVMFGAKTGALTHS
uniref:Uncharacterized protein n=1 Tax=Takifugu rubripes TaxID=31033 RepID=A0A674MXZ2_TAKRU